MYFHVPAKVWGMANPYILRGSSVLSYIFFVLKGCAHAEKLVKAEILQVHNWFFYDIIINSIHLFLYKVNDPIFLEFAPSVWVISQSDAETVWNQISSEALQISSETLWAVFDWPLRNQHAVSLLKRHKSSAVQKRSQEVCGIKFLLHAVEELEFTFRFSYKIFINKVHRSLLFCLFFGWEGFLALVINCRDARFALAMNFYFCLLLLYGAHNVHALSLST